MRSERIITLAGIILVVFVAGCSAWGKGRSGPEMTMLQVEGKAKPLPHKIAVALIQNPTSPFDAQLADHFFTTLVATIRSEGRWVNLMTPQDPGYPPFMAVFDRQNAPADVFSMAEAARKQGYQGVLTAYISDVRHLEIKTGILWFRKIRHLLSYTVSVSLYDVHAAAKIMDELREETLKIGLIDYEGFRDQTLTAIDDLNAEVADIAREFGQKAADILEDHPWKTTVTAVQEDRVFFTSGGTGALQVGDRLVVFEAGRFIEGKQGAQFVLHGQKIGEVRIIAVNGRVVESVVEQGGGIKEGDLVVAVK